MPPGRGRRGLLSATCCVILLGLVESLYLIRPRAPLDKAHQRFIIPNQFCGCSDDVAIYMKTGAPCPAGPQGKAESCPRASSFYQNFVPRTVAAPTTAMPDSAETASTGTTSIMVPGLAQGCSETAASCSTSYSFSWIGGAEASTNVTNETASTTKLPSVSASSAESGSTSMSPTASAISSSVSTATSTSMQISMTSSIKSSASTSMQRSCPTVSGILSSWTTTGTFMEDYAVVIRTDIAGFNGVSTVPICNLGTVTWMPVPTMSMPPHNAPASTNQIASGAGSNVWTTTITAQQGVQTVILALENTRASNGDTKILSTLSSSTVSPPSLTTSSSSLLAAPVPVPSSAAKTTGYTNSSTAQTIPVSISHTPGATWTTTMTLTQGSVTMVLVDLVSEVSTGSLIATLISASILESAVATSSSATVSRIFPVPAITSLSSGSTGMPLPPSSAQLTTVTIASPSPPFTNSSNTVTTSFIVTSAINSITGSSTIENTSTSSSSLTATTPANSSQTQGPPSSSVSINTAWTPAGSIFSTQYTYTITDGTFGAEVVVGKSSWLAVSINAHSTLTELLGKDVITIFPFTGTAPVGSTGQISVSASTTVAASPPSVSVIASSTTFVSSTNVSVVQTAASGGTFSTASSQLSSIASIKRVILKSSTRSRTRTVKSTTQSSSSIKTEALPTTTSALKSLTHPSESLNFLSMGKSTSGKAISGSVVPPPTSMTQILSNHISTVTSTYCDRGGGLQDGTCANWKTRHYTTTWYGKRVGPANGVEPTNIPPKFQRDVESAVPSLDGLGNDNMAKAESLETDEKKNAPIKHSAPVSHVTSAVSACRRNEDIHKWRIHPFHKKAKTPQALDPLSIHAANPALTTAAHQVLPILPSPTTHHPDHTSRASDEQQFSARELQGITICAQSNCVDTSFPPFSGATTATIPETEQGPLSTGAPYVPDSAAERIYRGVRWCLPWLGCVTFELVARVMTLVMFWEW